MKIKVLAFGPVAEITGNESEMEAGTTMQLRQMLFERYPELSTMQFSMAVNKKISHDETELKDGDTIALLPPFSGG